MKFCPRENRVENIDRPQGLAKQSDSRMTRRERVRRIENTFVANGTGMPLSIYFLRRRRPWKKTGR